MEKSYPYTLIPRYPGAREYPCYVGVWKERLKVNKGPYSYLSLLPTLHLKLSIYLDLV